MSNLLHDIGLSDLGDGLATLALTVAPPCNDYASPIDCHWMFTWSKCGFYTKLGLTTPCCEHFIIEADSVGRAHTTHLSNLTRCRLYSYNLATLDLPQRQRFNDIANSVEVLEGNCQNWCKRVIVLAVREGIPFDESIRAIRWAETVSPRPAAGRRPSMWCFS